MRRARYRNLGKPLIDTVVPVLFSFLHRSDTTKLATTGMAMLLHQRNFRSTDQAKPACDPFCQFVPRASGTSETDVAQTQNRLRWLEKLAQAIWAT